MNILRQLLIFSIVGFAGVFISSIIPFPLPSSIISMIILFFLLVLKIIKKDLIKEISTILVNNMGLFFIVPTISLIQYFDIIGENLMNFIFISIIATILTFLASTASIRFTIKLMEKRRPL